MNHESHATTPDKSARITKRTGRPSLRIEAQLASNMDVIAVASTIENELAKRLNAEVRQLHVCDRLREDLCEECRAIQEMRAEIAAVKIARVSENLRLTKREQLA